MHLERPILQRWLSHQLLDHLQIPAGHKLSGFFCGFALKAGPDSYLLGCIVPVAADQFLSLYLHCTDALLGQLLPSTSPPLSTFPDGAVIPFSRLEQAESLEEWIRELERCPLLETPVSGEKVTFTDRQGPYPVFRVTGVG